MEIIDDMLYPLAPDDWEGAAQDAAFAGRCFSRMIDGRLVNAQALDGRYAHRPLYEGEITRISSADAASAAAVARLTRAPELLAQLDAARRSADVSGSHVTDFSLEARNDQPGEAVA
ncbi:hypothetical protein [Burkholderia sp. Ac-20365]|uniref:hypothetical protein n=1 Tax=Burkholderia sp. Ac-20365 TaxID=2703897 RepID=UPI00197B8BE6|nr:hypothetical protein [Burkholderia sp. Ac-20365]MBN3761321.1 hypothetical protein [Burkholderia sp. Ac-20365]